MMWIPLERVDLKSNQEVTDHPHSYHATIASVAILCWWVLCVACRVTSWIRLFMQFPCGSLHCTLYHCENYTAGRKLLILFHNVIQPKYVTFSKNFLQASSSRQKAVPIGCIVFGGLNGLSVEQPLGKLLIPGTGIFF